MSEPLIPTGPTVPPPRYFNQPAHSCPVPASILSNNRSPLTLRGSALYTPSTSVQMVMWPLRNSAPMMVAEKSEPLRRSVVAYRRHGVQVLLDILSGYN